MNKVAIRAAVISRMKALTDVWSHSIPVFYENQDQVNLDKVGPEFICVMIDWMGSRQINLAAQPDLRYYGDIIILLFGKVGTGTASRLAMEDEITNHFKFKVLGAGCHVQAPTLVPGRLETHDGWHSITVAFPFFADSNS